MLLVDECSPKKLLSELVPNHNSEKSATQSCTMESQSLRAIEDELKEVFVSLRLSLHMSQRPMAEGLQTEKTGSVLISACCRSYTSDD